MDDLYEKKIVRHKIWKVININECNQWKISPEIRDNKTGGGNFKCICNKPFKNETFYEIIINKNKNIESAITAGCKDKFLNKIKETEVLVCKTDKNLNNKNKDEIYNLVLSYNKIYHDKPTILKNYTIDELVSEYRRSAKCLLLLDKINNKIKQFENYLNKKKRRNNCFKNLGMHTIQDFYNEKFNHRTFYDLEIDVDFLNLMKDFNSGIEGKQQSSFLNQSRVFKLYYISKKLVELKTMVKHIQETMVEYKEIENKTNQLNNYLEL